MKKFPDARLNKKTMKQLSTLTFNDKQFTVQTEIVHKPQYEVRSLVYYSGKVLLKKETPVAENMEQQELDQMVEQQHLAIEEEVKSRVYALSQKKNQQP